MFFNGYELARRFALALFPTDTPPPPLPDPIGAAARMHYAQRGATPPFDALPCVERLDERIAMRAALRSFAVADFPPEISQESVAHLRAVIAKLIHEAH
jgi:hypothetical protein